MNDVSPPHTSADDDALRAVIRRDMLRASSTMMVVLLALLILALSAGLASLRATRNLRRAEEAEATGRQRLASAYLAQARALRVAAVPERLRSALDAIRNAAAISHPVELRNEAIACLALSDLAPEGPLISTPRGLTAAEMDKNLEHFAYADPAGKIFIYDSANGKWSSQETGNYVTALCFSPDGKFLAASQSGGTVRVIDLGQGRFLPVPQLAAAAGIAFSADSRRLVFSDSTQGGRIAFYDLKSGEKSDSPVKAGLRLFRVSRDLGKAALSLGMEVNIVDMANGSNIMTLVHAAQAGRMAWSPDERKLAVSCENGDIYLWDLASGGHRILSGHSERCASLEFSPDGRLLVSSSQDGITRLWNVLLCQTMAAGEGVSHGFTPDGRRIGFWRPWKGFGIWQVSASDCYELLPCDVNEGPLFTLDLSTGGRWCVATQRTGFRVWDLRGGPTEAFVPFPDVFCARFMPDEKSLLVCGKSGLEIWPLTNRVGGVLDLGPEKARRISLPDGTGGRGVAASLDGRFVAVELTDRRLAVLDLTGSSPPVLLKERWGGPSLKGPGSATGAGRFAISPDGKWVATGHDFGSDDAPRIWNARSGDLAATLKADTSLVGFSPDGRWLGVAGMDQYSIWSVGDWKRQNEFDRDEPAITLGTLAFMPGAGELAVARTRQIVEIRDRVTGARLADLNSPVPQSVNSVRIALDGSMLVGATANDMVEVWRLDKLRAELGAMGLDWDPKSPAAPARDESRGLAAGNFSLTLASVLGAFIFAACFALLTLQRHRTAIKRFVVAEAMAAQKNRELDTARAGLMHSQKMQALGALATGIAHDFNNLLSVVRMSNKLISRRADKNAEILEHVTDIEQAVLQGKAVVGSMLGYASDRADDGEPVDVSAVVEDVVSLLSREFLSGIVLTLELERQTTKVNIGRGPLEQILLNLVVNASEAMQGEGRLKIVGRARPLLPARNYVMGPEAANEYFELTVMDSGPGIAPELIDRIFEPFFTTKRSGSKPGTGLGLSLVYSLAQQAGAALSVESGPGQGAAFTLVFPVRPPDPVRQMHSAQKGTLT